MKRGMGKMEKRKEKGEGRG
jgi:hypothetical protein